MYCASGKINKVDNMYFAYCGLPDAYYFARFGSPRLFIRRCAPKFGSNVLHLELEGNLIDMAKILIAEDDKALVETLEKWFLTESHVIDCAVSGSETLAMLQAFGYDAVILDWDLPVLSGLEVLRLYRGRGGTTPVLMLTGKTALEEKEAGFDAGADDYLTKPFHPRELSARLRALLRRPSQFVDRELTHKHITLDPTLKRVKVHGNPISLQPLECAVLEYMMRHPREVSSPEQLARRVWDSECDVSLDAIYTCVKKLRKKLSAESQSSIIKTIHGVGYTLEE